MKRLVLPFLCSLLLISCGGGEGPAEVACESQYWDGIFGTCLPGGWAVVDRETLRQRQVPEDVHVAFQTEFSVSGQFPSVAVTKEPLARPVTPEDYSKASVRAVSVLPGYEQVDIGSLEIDGETLALHVFTAQPRLEEPRRRFYQVSTVANSVGYTITATAPVTVNDENIEKAILLILDHATFVEPVQEEK